MLKKHEQIAKAHNSMVGAYSTQFAECSCGCGLMSLYLLDKKNKVIALAIHPKAVWYDMITEFVGEQKQ